VAVGGVVSAKVAIGAPLVPGLVEQGEDVVLISEPGLFGPMEFRGIKVNGMALCRLDSGDFELFFTHEISTVEAVAKWAARGLDDAAPGAVAA
jgi:hypothetical protein